MTNADKLNNMTNAELLLYMNTNDRCDSCAYQDLEFCLNRCSEGTTKWLESEAK